MGNPSISRREFAALSAGAAGAVLGTGTATSRSFSAVETTPRYEFLLNNVEDDHTIPTLVTFTDDSGYDVLAEHVPSYRSHEADLAAYAKLVPKDARAVVEAEPTEQVEYAPGSNPFWKLDKYGDGVFLDPEDSVDFIGLEEARSGVEFLEQRHGDRLNVRTHGNGPGHENLYQETTDPRDVWTLEVTENIGDTATFAEKEKLVFMMSVHGDERAGIEAGLRFVEEILDGQRADIEELLSEFVLLFVSPNPGGWVVREPIYDNPTEPPDFRRFNAAGLDPNRQYPVPGWILPSYAPGEPDGSNLVDDDIGDVDDDVPDNSSEQTPDTLAVVDHLRTYENVEYLLDLHGMYANSSAIASLTPAGGTPSDRAGMELLNRTLKRNIESSLGSVDRWQDTFETAVEDYENQDACQYNGFCETPETLFEYGSALDLFGYTPTGAIDSWAVTPESKGGLGATALTLEIVFANSFPEDMRVSFLPEITRFHLEAYGTAIETTIRQAANEVDGAVATGERSTAYLESDSLTRSSADLSYVGAGEAVAGGVGTASPVGGEYVHKTRVFGGKGTIDAGTTQLTATENTPDPEAVFGYQQQEYEVTPLSVFETLADYADAPVEPVGADEIRGGTLVADGTPTYDNLVVCHDDSIDTAFLTALTEYVEAGGNLVLTDAGVEVAAGLDIAGLESVDEESVSRSENRFPSYEVGDEETQQLLDDNTGSKSTRGRSIQEPWNYPRLGYKRGQSPEYSVSDFALGEAVEVHTGRDAAVRLASLPVQAERVGVHLLGSLLPPAEQGNLHPFGLFDHSLTLFGYQLLYNALGYRFDCLQNGKQEATFGSTIATKFAKRPDEQTPTETATPTATETAEPTPDETETASPADDDGPGFGPLTALAGAGTTSYVLRRRLDDTASDEGVSSD
ncbi:M14 family zinc carboxypeptidase [Halovenus rubra]|uniref:M14 family zinc carboxypeptidase n=2 Tax=Halovenus rubra TaxID=869890 RepID=A0ACC7E5A7_9EURY|nr:M14 family zinc carboxypeptidase [Halovenus rubra]